MSVLVITLLLSNSFPSCEDTIINMVNSYKIENDFTYYELFNDIDCNDDKCIDYYELKTFMTKIGIPWRCRWPDKVIEYFSEVKEENKGTLNNCIQWASFRNNFKNSK